MLTWNGFEQLLDRRRLILLSRKMQRCVSAVIRPVEIRAVAHQLIDLGQIPSLSRVMKGRAIHPVVHLPFGAAQNANVPPGSATSNSLFLRENSQAS